MPNISKTGVGSTLTFENEVVRMMNSGVAVVRGDILETHLDVDISNPVGTAATTWSAVSLTDSADQVPARVIGVALEDAAQWEYLRVGFKGVFECSVDGTPAVGSTLRVSGTVGKLTGSQTAPKAGGDGYITMIGLSMEAVVSGDLTKVLFDGLNGFTASHP